MTSGELDLEHDYASLLDKHVIKNPHLEATEWGWEKDATGLRIVMNDMYARFHKPLFILENGMGARESIDINEQVQDDYRISYHRNHIQAMKDAMLKDGVECLGYVTWGPIDIPSSSCEIAKRYGFVYVNRTDQELLDLRRIPKKSFYWIKKVFESNGEDLQ